MRSVVSAKALVAQPTPASQSAMEQGLVVATVPVVSVVDGGVPPSEADAVCVCCHETWVLGNFRLTATGWLTAASVLLAFLVFAFIVQADLLSMLVAFGINFVVRAENRRQPFQPDHGRACAGLLAALVARSPRLGRPRYGDQGLRLHILRRGLHGRGARGHSLVHRGADSAGRRRGHPGGQYAEQHLQGVVHRARKAVTTSVPLSLPPADVRCLPAQGYGDCYPYGPNLQCGQLPPLPCDVVKNVTASQGGMVSAFGKIPHTWRLFAFLFFMGYIDAATVEEGVKLVAARAKFPCCWKSTRCVPCCVPGSWRTDGLRDPYSFIIYMVAAAAGFSTAENMEYLFMTPESMNHRTRPDCFPPVEFAASMLNLFGRVGMAYPLHLLCGALTGVQLIRRYLAPVPLGWPWVLVPAVLTHGTYDFVLFVLAAMAGDPEEESESSGKGVTGMVLLVVGVQVLLGWVYFCIPAYWMRRKLRALDLPALKRAADGATADSAAEGSAVEPVAAEGGGSSFELQATPP